MCLNLLKTKLVGCLRHSRMLYDRIKSEKEPKEEKQNTEEDSLNPYEVEQVFRGPISSFESMEEAGWPCKPSLSKPQEVLLT